MNVNLLHHCWSWQMSQMLYCLLLRIWLQTTQIVSFAELMHLYGSHSLIPLNSWWHLFNRKTPKSSSEKCFVLKAPGIRGVTLRRDSATWPRARRPPQDGSEQLRLRDSTMTTPTTRQVSLSYFRDKSILNSQPPLLIHAAPPHLTLSSLAHFLSILPVSGNRTTADLSSPVFLPSQTCQVKKKI